MKDLEFAIASKETEIVPAADRAVDALRAAGFVGDRGAPRLKLAVIELVTNAIEHGNRFDPKKRVRIVVRARGKRASITIGDEGPGLDPAILDRDLGDVALSSKRGRGLSLVKKVLGARPALNAARNEVTIAFDREMFA